jgi:hypothetical protein
VGGRRAGDACVLRLTRRAGSAARPNGSTPSTGVVAPEPSGDANPDMRGGKAEGGAGTVHDAARRIGEWEARGPRRVNGKSEGGAPGLGPGAVAVGVVGEGA